MFNFISGNGELLMWVFFSSIVKYANFLSNHKSTCFSFPVLVLHLASSFLVASLLVLSAEVFLGTDEWNVPVAIVGALLGKTFIDTLLGNFHAVIEAYIQRRISK